MVKLKTLGADLLFDVSTPKFAAQAIKKAAEIEWKPVHILDINATGVSEVMKPAGPTIPRASSASTTARTCTTRSGRTTTA